MVKIPTIAEIEALMDAHKDVKITPTGKVIIGKNPIVHVLEDVLRISELEKALNAIEGAAIDWEMDWEEEPKNTHILIDRIYTHTKVLQFNKDLLHVSG